MACLALQKRLADQDEAFVERVKSIRTQHLLLQDYDRQMISALTDRRTALQATHLTELSVVDEIDGCSGSALDDMQHKVQREMVNLRGYLSDFNRAVKSDPDGVFIDQ